jgi:catechol 2,3-dioxygenase-like lactoylglutathione lyase family enzyme
MNDLTAQLTERLPPVLQPLNGDAAPAVSRPVLHHVQLKTTRLAEMVAWYSKVLGVIVCHQGSGAAWLTNDEANHRIAIISTPRLHDDPDRLSHTGLHHTAWEYGSIDELLDTYVRLRDQGQLPHRTVNHGPITSFYYEDPDGNSVELQNDNFGDWRESVKFFRGEDFERDPFGPGVDPEALLAARQAGSSTGDLAQRSYAGEFPVARPNDRRLAL